MDQNPTPSQFPEEKKLRGLYRHVKISVKTLDRIIVAGLIAIVLVLIFAVRHGGYTISFDANGGTDVASQSLVYGDLVEEPEPPTREGYTFSGWFSDEALETPWDFDTPVSASMELYAGWDPSN
jgi:uncharacterized repeat protein (TIGR02543 family)